MAAVGLMPEHRISEHDEKSAAHYMSALVEFVFAMKEKLININDNSYNNFMLRVGELEFRNRNLFPFMYEDFDT